MASKRFSTVRNVLIVLTIGYVILAVVNIFLGKGVIEEKYKENQAHMMACLYQLYIGNAIMILVNISFIMGVWRNLWLTVGFIVLMLIGSSFNSFTLTSNAGPANILIVFLSWTTSIVAAMLAFLIFNGEDGLEVELFLS